MKKAVGLRALLTAAGLISLLTGASSLSAQRASPAKAAMVEPDVRKQLGPTIELSDYENHANPKAMADLIRRRASAENHAGKAGVVRFWSAQLCGATSDRVFVTTEFPTAMAMAQAREKNTLSSELRRWEDDAQAAGLTLKSRYTMIDLNPREGRTGTAPSSGAAPHVLQFNEFDVNDKGKFIATGLEIEKMIDGFVGADGGLRRHWTIAWAGEHPGRLVNTVEFPSHSAMIRTVEGVDFQPAFGRFQQQMGELGVKRVFECVMTELRP